jgi:hypothetical protein
MKRCHLASPSRANGDISRIIAADTANRELIPLQHAKAADRVDPKSPTANRQSISTLAIDV